MKQRLPAPIPVDLSITASVGGAETYQGDTTIYDSAGATGSISGATVLGDDTIYDAATATGSINGTTVLPADTTL